SIPPQRVVEKTGRGRDLFKRGQLGSFRRNMMPLLCVNQVLDCGNSICHFTGLSKLGSFWIHAKTIVESPTSTRGVSLKRCHSLRRLSQEGNSSIQSILRLQRLCMKILALATTGPNSPNGSNSPSYCRRTHLLRCEVF
ncbi:hypothetical protein TNCV_5023031, partial [Trichonephila clavipes]